jgi:hypothetical protein
VVVRDSHGYKIISGHFQYHAAVLARQLNPKAGKTIPAIVLESENQTTGERTTFDAKRQSRLDAQDIYKHLQVEYSPCKCL